MGIGSCVGGKAVLDMVTKRKNPALDKNLIPVKLKFIVIMYGYM